MRDLTSFEITQVSGGLNLNDLHPQNLDPGIRSLLVNIGGFAVVAQVAGIALGTASYLLNIFPFDNPHKLNIFAFNGLLTLVGTGIATVSYFTNQNEQSHQSIVCT